MKKKEYGTYHFTGKEWIRYTAEGIALGSILNVLFYQTLWACAGIPPLCWFYLRSRRRERILEQRKTLNHQFKDALSSISVSFQAGFSVENAVRICRRDLERLYGSESDLVRELSYMESQMKVSVPVEQLFLDLGERSGVEDIMNFAEVFYNARRSGGDLEKILHRTSQMIGDKIDVRKEIEATLAAKKSEQTIMSLMPFGIILYLQLTSPGFLSVLYGNALGAAVMTVCLTVYAFAWWMGRKIVEIQV